MPTYELHANIYSTYVHIATSLSVIGNKLKEGFISPENFIYFFINSDSNLTQTQILALKLFPSRTLTQTLT